jgi:hypothetical protein
MENVKVCKSCGLLKSLDCFRNRSKSKDGKQYCCKECNNIGVRKWGEVNKVKKSEYQKTWNQQIQQDSGASYNTNRRFVDPSFKLANNLRVRLNKAVQRNSGISAVKDLGCSIEYFKKYLESKFELGMSWDNYGEWHIDHIKPLVRFNLLDSNELSAACHYSNLQPLWAKPNLSKNK